MYFENGAFNEWDLDAAKILDGFLPDKIFDAHMHIFDSSFAPNISRGGGFSVSKRADFDDYVKEMAPLFGSRREIRANMLTAPDVTMADAEGENRRASVAFLAEQLERHPECVGEVIVGPRDTPEQIEKQLVHPGICGFKCYYFLADDPHGQVGIDEYLSDTIWEIADKRGLVITLHMMRDKALADPGNLSYIMEKAKKYPNAKLILAHCARAFATWTVVETVDQIKHFDNIYYDFSAICESPAMFQIIRKAGLEKCMWGSDYPVCRIAGKAISLADGFYWINKSSLESFPNPAQRHAWQLSTENLMATRQACLMLDLNTQEIEDLFWNNAMRLFRLQ